jgi:CRISPR-associated endonuclease Cas1
MAATENLRQLPESLQPRQGVIALFGYGISIRVDRGHLLLQDGIGAARRAARFSRVGHGLRRLVCIGNDGMISLAALRWLADQDAAFVTLNRDGTVLATTGPVRPSDARLRRAQALAAQSGKGLHIARELIHRKLAGQEKVARHKLLDSTTAEEISQYKETLSTAENLDAIRLIESRAAAAYWSPWRDLPVTFPKCDLSRVPEHWRVFGTRKSSLTGSPRLATNPPNAILNYLYALLESEARLAAAALGLDPGLGMLHVDTPARDSLACDLMEVVRPHVDGYVLDWITRQPLRREWFFEQRDGNCRLMGSFAVRLSETAPTWGRAVAPIAEWVARTLWQKTTATRQTFLPTRLTQSRKREAKGSSPTPIPEPTPQVESRCRDCGTTVGRGRIHCPECAVVYSTDRLKQAAQAGRLASHTAQAETRRAETQRKHAVARYAWSPSDQPEWLSDGIYAEEIQPRLAHVANSAIASALGVSLYYAADIRRGRRRPHPRYWLALAKLIGFSGG